MNNKLILAVNCIEYEQIENDIQDINEIFKGLGEIITEQGYKLDKMGSNIEDVVMNVEVASEELIKASYYGKLTSALTMGLIGGAVAGPIGFIVGIKSSIALVGLSVGSGYVSYKVTSLL